jgi:pimeloyl-ACP methyl ester carboxylesterase
MTKPTILLIHGGFGDASSWRPVFDLLDGDEYTVLAPPSPLRGVAANVAYTAAVIDQLEGPIVLVGHSYSGCVITAAGASDKVAGLVYVAGFAPDEGESITDNDGHRYLYGPGLTPYAQRHRRQLSVTQC